MSRWSWIFFFHYLTNKTTSPIRFWNFITGFPWWHSMYAIICWRTQNFYMAAGVCSGISYTTVKVIKKILLYQYHKSITNQIIHYKQQIHCVLYFSNVLEIFPIPVSGFLCPDVIKIAHVLKKTWNLAKQKENEQPVVASLSSYPGQSDLNI